MSPHLIVASPLCPLLQFTNRVSGAVKCCHSAAQQRSSEYWKTTVGNVLVTHSPCCFFLFPHFIFFYWIMKNLWLRFDLVYHFRRNSCSACFRYSAALERLSLWGVGREQSTLWDAARLLITALTLQRKIWWLKFIFDTVIIKLLKTIKRLPISPVLVSLCLSPPF